MLHRFNEAEARAPRIPRAPARSSNGNESFNEAEARAPRIHGQTGIERRPPDRFNEAEARAPRIQVIHRCIADAEFLASMRPRRVRLGYRLPYNTPIALGNIAAFSSDGLSWRLNPVP